MLTAGSGKTRVGAHTFKAVRTVQRWRRALRTAVAAARQAVARDAPARDTVVERRHGAHRRVAAPSVGRRRATHAGRRVDRGGARPRRQRCALGLYQSLPKFPAAVKQRGAHVSVAVFDEAHTMADYGSRSGLGLDGDTLPVALRLFMIIMASPGLRVGRH